MLVVVTQLTSALTERRYSGIAIRSGVPIVARE